MTHPSEPPDTIHGAFSSICESFCRYPSHGRALVENENSQFRIPIVLKALNRLRVPLQNLLETVGSACKVHPSAIIEHGREWNVADARHIFCIMARTSGYSNEEVSTFLGRRDHTAVVSSARRAACLADSDPKFSAIISEVAQEVRGYTPKLYFEAVSGVFWPIKRIVGFPDSNEPVVIIESSESFVTMIRFEEIIDENEINLRGRSVSPVVPIISAMPPGSTMPVGRIAEEAGLAYPAAWMDILKHCHSPGARASVVKNASKPYNWIVVSQSGDAPLPPPPPIPVTNRGHNPNPFQRRWNWPSLKVGDIVHMPGPNHNANRSQAIKACSKLGFSIQCTVHPAGGTLVKRTI